MVTSNYTYRGISFQSGAIREMCLKVGGGSNGKKSAWADISSTWRTP
jgi:hypothetical protein